jgi:hypothetical protein
MKKIIILVSLLYIVNISPIESEHDDCLCRHSHVVKYVLEVKENVAKKIQLIPDKTKKIVANSVVKAESLYDSAKQSIVEGIAYVKNVATDIINWAHETQDSQ